MLKSVTKLHTSTTVSQNWVQECGPYILHGATVETIPPFHSHVRTCFHQKN